MCGGKKIENFKKIFLLYIIILQSFKILLTYCIKYVQYLVKFVFSTSEQRFDFASMHICMTFICVLDYSGSCQM